MTDQPLGTDAAMDALARLRHDAFVATGFYPGGTDAVAWIRSNMARYVAEGRLWRLGSPTEPRAFLLRWVDPDPPTAAPTTWVLINRVNGAEEAQWCRGLLLEVLDGVGDELNLQLPAWDAEVRRGLSELGVRVAKVDLAGRVDLAWERFRARYGEPDPPPGEVRDATPDDADAIIRLYREVFTAEPVYGAHMAHEPWLASERDRLRAGLAPGLHRLVIQGGRVRGYVGATWQVPNPHHGSAAGLNLVLGADLRGRGLGRWAYGEILRHLAENGIGWLKGATARPQVMHMARILGRGVTGVTFRRDVDFPPGWFDEILPGTR